MQHTFPHVCICYVDAAEAESALRSLVMRVCLVKTLKQIEMSDCSLLVGPARESDYEL